jgi:hypothetical protein
MVDSCEKAKKYSMVRTFVKVPIYGTRFSLAGLFLKAVF